jgi:hypothetical protein
MSHWIIQDKVFGEETDRLIETLKKADVKYQLTPWPHTVYTKDFIVSRGTLNFVECNKYLYESYRTLKLDVENFKCSSYYPLFGAHNLLLNADAIWMPWDNFCLRGEKMFEMFKTDKLFIRPDSGHKIFTGTTIRPKWFEKELHTITTLPSTSGLKGDTMILVAPAKKITKEARFLFGPSGLVDGAWYNNDGSDRELALMTTFAQDCYMSHFGPFMTVDMCFLEDENLPRIVEVNSFESAGLYDMDMDKVVDAVEQYARTK